MLSTRPVAGDQETAQAPAPAKFLKLALARCNALRTITRMGPIGGMQSAGYK